MPQQLAWSDEQTTAAPSQKGSDQFAWSDEKEAGGDTQKPSQSAHDNRHIDENALHAHERDLADSYGRSFGFAAGGGLSRIAGEAEVVVPSVGSFVKRTFYDPAVKAYKAAVEDPPIFPGANRPSAPPVELRQANSLYRGARTANDPAAGLGGSPVLEGEYVESETPAAAHPPVAPAQDITREVAARTPAPYRRVGGIEPDPVHRQPNPNLGVLVPRSRGLSLPGAVEPPAATPAAAVVRSAGPTPEYPPAAPARPIAMRPEPGSREDLAETKQIQAEVRDAAENEDRNRLLAVQRDRYPWRTKFDLTNQPVKFTQTPGVAVRGRSGRAVPAPVVPAPDQDLTNLLEKSVKFAQRSKPKK